MSNLSEEDYLDVYGSYATNKKVMSEEEILKRINEIKKEYSTMDALKEYVQAIDGIIDLYSKEKEKNKELIEGQVKTIETLIQPELFKKYIRKDKIREKLKEYEKEYQIYVGREYTGMNDLIVKIKTLRELLEEEND